VLSEKKPVFCKNCLF